MDSHDSKLEELENLVKGQAELIEEMKNKQVELTSALESKQVQLEAAIAESKVQAAQELSDVQVELKQSQDQAQANLAQEMQQLTLRVGQGEERQVGWEIKQGQAHQRHLDQCQELNRKDRQLWQDMASLYQRAQESSQPPRNLIAFFMRWTVKALCFIQTGNCATTGNVSLKFVMVSFTVSQQWCSSSYTGSTRSSGTRFFSSTV